MLPHYYNVIPSQFCVQRMLDGIQGENALTIDMANTHVLKNILGDWLVSVSYMYFKVAIKLPPSSGGGSTRKGDHRI